MDKQQRAGIITGTPFKKGEPDDPGTSVRSAHAFAHLVSIRSLIQSRDDLANDSRHRVRRRDLCRRISIAFLRSQNGSAYASANALYCAQQPAGNCDGPGGWICCRLDRPPQRSDLRLYSGGDYCRWSNCFNDWPFGARRDLATTGYVAADVAFVIRRRLAANEENWEMSKLVTGK